MIFMHAVWPLSSMIESIWHLPRERPVIFVVSVRTRIPVLLLRLQGLDDCLRATNTAIDPTVCLIATEGTEIKIVIQKKSKQNALECFLFPSEFLKVFIHKCRMYVEVAPFSNFFCFNKSQEK